MSRFKKPLLFALALLPIAAVGGYCTALMSVSSMDPSQLEEAVRQIGSKELLLALSTVQPIFLTLIGGFFGYILSEKIGLMRPFRFEKPELIRSLFVSVIGGAIFSLDAWTFARWIPVLAASYETTGSFVAVTWIASVLYGGVIEEVLLRLFFMSLIAFLVWKLLFKKAETVPAGALVAANITAALVFAAGHLPATVQTFGSLTALLVFRCFLMNGAFGLVFGWLYRKSGIQYAMLAHMLFHIVSKTIWILSF